MEYGNDPYVYTGIFGSKTVNTGSTRRQRMRENQINNEIA